MWRECVRACVRAGVGMLMHDRIWSSRKWQIAVIIFKVVKRNPKTRSMHEDASYCYCCICKDKTKDQSQNDPGEDSINLL